MKLCDVNVFVRAHREEATEHAFYREWLTQMLESKATFLYCEFILSAFVRIVTHPRIFSPPSPLPTALKFAGIIRKRPNGIAIMPGAHHWEIFERLCTKASAAGNLVPDAYLAALAIEAQAEWVSTDRDYAAFEPELGWHLLEP